MSVGEVACSREQLCSLPALRAGPAPAELRVSIDERTNYGVSQSPPLAVRDMTNLQGGERGEREEVERKRQNKLYCCPEVNRRLGDDKVGNCHGNKERTSGVSEPGVGLSGASLLRQQWARQHNLLHISDPPLENNVETELAGGHSATHDKTISHVDCPASSSPDTPAGHRPSRQLLKTHSMGSISSESLTISSLWEAPSYDTVPDFLSSLGFDDFDSPELIPDRFIPPELDFARPSLMRQTTLGSVQVSDGGEELSDNLALGAAADSVTPDPLAEPDDPPLPPQTLALYLPSSSQLPWQPASLETVVEESSELLSPRPPSRQSARLTPRLSSPFVSIDHTPTQDQPVGVEGDVSAGLLGAGLKLRQQSLVRDDLRGRQMSLGAESDTSSLYFSVGSHFDEGEREAESGSGGKEGVAPTTSGEEADTPSRRRRRGNYVPPPQLLMWLEKSESIEDTGDQPWPFSEKEQSVSEQPATHKALSDPLPQPPAISLNANFNSCEVISGEMNPLRLSERERNQNPPKSSIFQSDHHPPPP